MNNESTAALVFVSYSSKDKEYCEQLVSQLKPLRLEKILEVFVDEEQRPGEKFNPKIHEAIQNAVIGVLFVSEHSLGSDFIHDFEINPMRKRLDTDSGFHLIPVICKDCVWRNIKWLSELTFYPFSGEPLETIEPIERRTILMKLATQIAEMISEVNPEPNPKQNRERRGRVQDDDPKRDTHPTAPSTRPDEWRRKKEPSVDVQLSPQKPQARIDTDLSEQDHSRLLKKYAELQSKVEELSKKLEKQPVDKAKPMAPTGRQFKPDSQNLHG